MYRFQTVLHTVFGFDRIFFSGFSVLDDFFYGFAVSNIGPNATLLKELL